MKPNATAGLSFKGSANFSLTRSRLAKSFLPACGYTTPWMLSQILSCRIESPAYPALKVASLTIRKAFPNFHMIQG